MKNITNILRKWLPSIEGGGWGWVCHAFALIRADKLFSGIYIAGTAVAIASAMVVAIVLNILLADIAPEVNRSRTLYLTNTFYKESHGEERHLENSSTEAIDSCFRRMKCVEFVAPVIPPGEHWTISASDMEARRTIKSLTIMGSDTELFRLYDYRFVTGRRFSEKEFRDGEHVCVITDRVANQLGLFPLEKPEGEQSILINKVPFRVVGIIKSPSFLMQESAADIFAPYTAECLGYRPDGKLETSYDISYAGNLEARIILKKGYSRKDFLEEFEPIRTQYEAITSTQVGESVSWTPKVKSHWLKKITFFGALDVYDDTTYKAMNLLPPVILMLLFLFLPAINLSGLVSNRMEARRAEMGIRKAFGAKRRTLLREVIFENLVLTLCGGLVGWVLSWLFVSALRYNGVFQLIFMGTNDLDTMNAMKVYSLNYQMFVTPTLFLVVFLCCAVLNLMVALIPAWRSLKNPIVESLNQKR
ncbi:MAG: ABC transporter permease [Bacteroidaceae bacterium]|nr:ABC transporter permease [Bacteroidaceae bacterium]